MGTSRDTGGSRAAGGATGGNAPIQMGGISNTNQRRAQRFMRSQRAAGRTGAVSREEFIQATGVNPQTGRRVRRRP